MPLRPFIRAATALTLTLTPLAALADGPWQGNWDTSYSDLNLIQDGRLVYGEYVDRGWIIGYTNVTGDVLRGAWVHENSGRWGGLEFRLSGPASFDGSWVENRASFNFEEGTNWDGDRMTISPGYFPEGLDALITFPEEFDLSQLQQQGWFDSLPIPGSGVQPLDPIVVTTPECPVVAIPVGLNASNNPDVLANGGIADATSAPWTIYAQPPAAPLGSLDFRGDAITMRMDACLPLFGPTLASERHLIIARDVVLSRRGDGDYQGTGWFHDVAAGIQGRASFYLTDPTEGQGLASLTVSGEGGRWSESILLDYTAD